MSMLYFFAAHDDLVAILKFLFEQTDVRVFESYSECERELREFRSVEEMQETYQIGTDRYGNGLSILLKLWSPSVMETLHIERINLNPQACRGHTFRYAIRGWGLIQLYLGGVYENVLTLTQYQHNSQKRARAWGAEEGVNWEALKKLSGKIQYHIRGRLAVTKASGFPVLPHALELAKQGFQLKQSAHSPGRCELPVLPANKGTA